MEEKLCPQCQMPEIEKLPACPLQCRSKQCKAYQKKSKFDPKTKPIIWILGGPGSGKFTQCKKIIETYGFTHLSTGDIIRDEVNRGSDRSKCLNSIMDRGGLVPNDLVLAVLKEAIEAAAEKGSCGYLVDGYPREKSQGIEFEKTIGPVTLILYFAASTETLTARLLSRAETSGRKDDNIETIRLRLQTFLKNNQSVIEPYGEKVVTINAERPPDAIFADVRKVMDPVVARAKAIEAEIAEAEASEKAKVMKAFAGSSVALAQTSNTKGIKKQGAMTAAKAETDAAEARAKAANERAEAAKTESTNSQK